MDNQKGSIRDRLRARKRYLEYKKYRRQKEKEIKKRKKREYEARVKAEQIRLYGKTYSKIKVFCLTIIGLLFGLITPKNSKSSIQKELDVIEKEKKQIFFRLEQDQDVQEIYSKIDNTYQKLEDLKKKHKTQILMNSFDPRSSNKLLKNIDEKQRELMVINEICHKKESENLKYFVNREESLQKDKKQFHQQEDIEKNINPQGPAPFEEKTSEVKTTKIILKNIKEMTDNIKDYTKEMDFLREKIDQEELYNTLFEYEFKLKQLKIRLSKMLEDYEDLDEKYDLETLEEILDIDVFDKYELRKDEKPILRKLEECECLLQEIKNKKEILSTKKKNRPTNQEETKKEVEVVNQEEKVIQKQEEDKKELKEQFDELYLANKIILNNIMEEKKMVDKMVRKLSNVQPLVRKKSIFTYANRFMSSILSFGLSFFPIQYFRNRFMGTLISGIMLNNSLRTTRKILNYDNYRDNYVFYQDFVKEINSNQDYVSKIYDVCLDSQFQIRKIKEHLDIHFSMISEYDAELSDFYRQLDKLNHQLEHQINSLAKMNRRYKHMKQKIKEKEWNREY